MAGMWVWERPGPRPGARPGLPDRVLWPKAVRGRDRWDGMGPDEPPHMAACSRRPLRFPGSGMEAPAAIQVNSRKPTRSF